MARGGINKVLVKQAREALIARGENPSIDRVRIELGNTGSKATIHRYLKELEMEEGTQLNDETLLSSTLRGMVAGMAAQLHREAQGIVADAKAKHQQQLTAWESRHTQQAQALTEAEQRIASLERDLADSTDHCAEAVEARQRAVVDAERRGQQIADLEALLREKGDHLASLEEKHHHSREVLNHYRESVKEQREQDQRRHDQQVQQLQAEQRQLREALSVKQSDITQLNKDNARLVAELSEVRKQLVSTEGRLADVATQLKTAESTVISTGALLKEKDTAIALGADSLTALQTKLDSADKTNRSLEIELATLKATLGTEKVRD